VGADCTVIFTNTKLNQVEYYSPRFDCINLASTVAGSLSFFVGCFCSKVGNDTSIPTGGASSDVYDVELSSLSWKSSVGGDPKVESGSNVGNGTSILPVACGALRESSDAYDEPFSVSWKSSGRRSEDGIRRKVLVSKSQLTRVLRRMLNSGCDSGNLEDDEGPSLGAVPP
jgi:hypothetical protein